jgi:hypothetical protein
MFISREKRLSEVKCILNNNVDLLPEILGHIATMEAGFRKECEVKNNEEAIKILHDVACCLNYVKKKGQFFLPPIAKRIAPFLSDKDGKLFSSLAGACKEFFDKYLNKG